MNIKNILFYLYNPFRKYGDEHLIGYNLYIDWNHSYEFNIRVGFKYPHLTICHAYTKEKTNEYIVKFWTFSSEKYRNHRGGTKFYEYSCTIQNIEDGRDAAG